VTVVKENADLRYVVNVLIEERKESERISPAWIATEAMIKLEVAGLQQTLPPIYLAAHLYLRQVARNACRRQFESDDDALDPDQQELFPGLQSRYPVAHEPNEDPSYVLRDRMTRADVKFNINRLRLESKTKAERADALEAWAEQEGKLPSNRKRGQAVPATTGQGA
jgi:hypothetical protein